MALFFIEMGQGIVVDGDVSVCTSTLFSCSLIAGWNQNTNAAGAYHYPASSLGKADVLADMNAWAARLQPMQVILVVADAMNALEVQTFGRDEAALQAWIQQQCQVAAAVDHQTAAAMCFQNGHFSAGVPSALPGGSGAFGRSSAISVTNRQAGVYPDHGGFTLIGHDRENAPRAAVHATNANANKPACCIIL